MTFLFLTGILTIILHIDFNQVVKVYFRNSKYTIR